MTGVGTNRYGMTCRRNSADYSGTYGIHHRDLFRDVSLDLFRRRNNPGGGLMRWRLIPS